MSAVGICIHVFGSNKSNRECVPEMSTVSNARVNEFIADPENLFKD